MYRKLVWCYVFVLTLLDISLNTKLSAQGKSHGVTVHDSIIEGITFQEWGKESGGEGGARGGRAVAAGALQLSPPALDFGRAALAAAHALTVTLTNTANTTMHLASVAGTTPDFHASFFESKTLPPQANTSFSVVYLGRREGPVSAHLYIHTSLGVHKYPVSAVGVASEWGVWPLVGVRVPHNATVEPLLTMHNPTDQTIQVSEVYSSGAWLGLVLPGGGRAAPRAVWSVPPRATRPLVRLRVAPPPAHTAHTAHTAHPLTAYVRIKANITGGGLVVCVEARSVPAGEFVSPLQLRLRTRGSLDPPDVFDIAAGNSADAAVELEAGVWAARCAATPPAPTAPPSPEHAPPNANGQSDKGTSNGNGVKADGVYVSLLQPSLAPHAPLERAAQLTLDYAKMWAGYGGGARGDWGAWCGGWLRVGRAALPYSLRLLPGTLRITPPQAHFVTSNTEDAVRVREILVRNEFPVGVLIARVDLGPDVEKHFEVESLAPHTLAAGGAGAVARVRLRAAGPPAAVRAHLTLRTNLTDYTLPLLAYSGELHVEWDWPNSSDGTLRLGVVGTSSTRRVRATLHNRAPTALCVREHSAELPGATLALQPCAHLRAPPPTHACRCIGAGEAVTAWLTVVAPARAGELRGAVLLWAAPPAPAPPAPAPPALTRRAVQLDAQQGRVHALPLHLYHAAPYAWSSAPLVLESSMALRMRMLSVTLPPDDPAVFYEPPSDPQANEVSAGHRAVGTVYYAAERLCEPHCYTGLDVTRAEGQAWVRRGASPSEEALRADAALQAARYQLYLRHAAPRNLTLHAHTSRCVQLPARAHVQLRWPRLAARQAAAGLAGVRATVPLALRARNPSASHALLLQPVLGAHVQLAGDGAAAACSAPACAFAAHTFALAGWRARSGEVRVWREADNSSRALPLLLLAPLAELELRLSFTPHEPSTLAAYLYLRNNLTIVEAVQVWGRGAIPSFSLGGRRPGSSAPLLFEVSECGGTVRRTVVARNTGQVVVRVREWRLAGEPCQARGFRLTPCAPLALAPNESRALTIAFTPDYTLARAAAELTARTDTARAAFLLRAAAPARLLPRCRAAAPRPPWEPAARAAAALLALAALALVLAAAALDAERELRRARQQRPPPAARAPLDLRALAHSREPAPAPPARRAPPRRRRTPRRDAPPLDPHAERRAFERWRAEVLRRADDDDSRSSEDADGARPPDPPHATDDTPLLDSGAPEPRDDPPPTNDGYEADPETEDRPQGSGDDDAISTGSGSTSASSSSPTVDDRDEADDGDEPEREPPRDSPAPAADDCPGAGAVRADSTGRAGPPAAGQRVRRDHSETPRRGARSRTAEGGEGRARAATKPHARKAALAARRVRPGTSPARPEAPRAAGGAGGAGGAGAGALRWGASWSSVVAARGALAPIGSDVRRRAEPGPALGGAGDHSLFYFNGDAAHAHPAREADFSWRPPPPVERPAFTPARDFLEEPGAVGTGAGAGGAGGAGTGTPGAVGSGAFRPLQSVWGSVPEPRPAAAAWLWGGYAEAAPAPVRPPPGFGAPRPVRAYDPFRSLASIWAPGAHDWRPDAPDDHAHH